jgi:hypothetical protein
MLQTYTFVLELFLLDPLNQFASAHFIKLVPISASSFAFLGLAAAKSHG